MKGWNVYLHGRLIDTVYFDQSMTKDQILRSLINHDGYDYRIKVKASTLVRAEDL